MFDFLKGYKFYVLAVVVGAIGVSEGLLGVDIPGVEVGSDWLNWVLMSLGMGFGRAAVAKAGSGA
jgi:hypothetical protein